MQFHYKQKEATISVMRKYITLIAPILLVLAIPLIGMIASDEVAWRASDFVLAIILVGLLSKTIQLVYVKYKGFTRIALIAIPIIFVMLIWAELSVGLFD